MKAYTTDFFIERAKNVYGDKYDYSKTIYINTETPLTITCPNHGEFKIRPLKFLQGRECKSCKTKTTKNTYKLTTEQFVEKAQLIHGDKYDYSKVSYVNQKTKIVLICKKHGEFEVVPNYHLTDRCGCKFCAKESIKEKTSYTTEKFIEEAKKIHGNKYNYHKVKYINYNTKVIIICTKHGDFEISPLHHINSKSGCQKCGYNVLSLKSTYTQEEFTNKAKETHGEKYDYSLVKYTDSKIKVNIICKKHGEFKQMPAMHLQGQGCPNCVNSMGENEIFYLLTKNNIKFNTQHKFDNCVHKRKLPFDFYLPQKNVCIEFQGAQHYSAYHHMGGEKAYQKLIVNDQIKKEFCKKNNITLLEIKFDENIESKLREFKII